MYEVNVISVSLVLYISGKILFIFNVFLVYIIHSYIFYRVFRKTGMEYAWYVFVPIFPIYMIPFFHTLNRSVWYVFLWFIPVVNIYFIIRDIVEFYHCFGLKSGRTALISFLYPFGMYMVLIYIASSKQVTYRVYTNRYFLLADDEEEEGFDF